MSPLLVPVLGTLLDRVLPDPKIASDAKVKLLEMQQTGDLAELENATKLALGQLEVNKVEAGTDWFRGGWRPMTGWVCAGGLGYQIIVRPLLAWVSANWLHWTVPPSLETETLMTLLFGMLGLGAYRTTERLKGKA